MTSLQVELPDGCCNVEVVPDTFTVEKYIRHVISSASSQDENPLERFCIIDLGELSRLYEVWMDTLPEVAPFYAVKVFDDPVVLKILAQLGAGFDCASLAEMKSVLELGVSPDRIIFAQPCKLISHLKFAAENQVTLMTFDSLSELHKIKKYSPTARLVVRIAIDCEDATSPLGEKFGCSVAVAKELLEQALSMSLTVVGVSFHVGSGCKSPSSYSTAIEMSAKVFEHAASIGCELTILDIGGGYPGTDKMELFLEEAEAIKQSLSKYFNRESFPNLRVIAEPGRFFTTTLVTEAVSVVSIKTCQEAGSQARAYYVTDGLYGTLSNARYDPFVQYTPKLLETQSPSTSSEVMKSTVWGPTLSCLDKICEADLPELSVGDWLYFENIGAYAQVCATKFNGFRPPPNYFFIRNERVSDLKKGT